MSSSSTVDPSAPAIGRGLVLPGDRPATVVAFESAMVVFFVDAAELLGVPKSVAAIYGIIFASPEPLGFSEIEARLAISKGSVSQGLRVLREMGAICVSGERQSDPSTEGQDSSTDKGSRSRDRYIPDLELRKLVARFLEHRLEKQLKSGSQRLKAIKQLVPTGAPTVTDELDRRLKSLSDWHSRARQLVPVARTFLKLS